MNELLFFVHIITVVAFTFCALALGRSALVAVICLQAVLANLFVLKQINLFGLPVTCGNVFAIGSVFGLNLLQEYFGKDVAKKAVLISFFTVIFYLIVSQFHILYIPNSFDTTQHMFRGLLGLMPRITIVSVLAFFVCQRFGRFVYAVLNNLFAGKFLTARNIISTSIEQLFDTALFTFFALYGIVESVWSIMLLSFVVKGIIIFASSPFISLSYFIMRRLRVTILPARVDRGPVFKNNRVQKRVEQ